MRIGPRRIHLPRHRLVLAAYVVAIVAAGSLFLFAHTVASFRALRATGPNWSFPSRVFSDGVPLTVGRAAPIEYLRAELIARDYVEQTAPPTRPGTFTADGGGLTIFLHGFLDEVDPLGGGGPERIWVRLERGRIAEVRRLGGTDGGPPPDLAHAPRLEPVMVSMLFDDERMWRTYVPLVRVPQSVRDAVVASEDRRFFTHMGVDPRGAIRALSVNLREKGIEQGGSTITQQLARGLFLGRERTFARKLSEVPLALALETMLTKDQILEMYLNSVYWGQADGFAVGGIADAAEWYFDVPVESLTVVQGATLAAMIPAPNTISPFKDPQRVLRRRNTILEMLARARRLPPGEADRLAALPLGIHRGRAPVERFPAYSSYVKDVLEEHLPHHAATHFGLAIFTTMDLAWQETAEEGMRSGLAILDPAGGPHGLEGAFVALDPATGSVMAMVGGRTPTIGGFNRAYQAKRQSGSAIKPIVYAAAFSSGASFTPASTEPDTQRTFGSGKNAWRPQNFEGEYHREVTLARALESSLNLATTALVEQIGPRTVAEAASQFGLPGLKPVLSIGLGSNEVSLLQLTSAYSVFASGGMLRAPTPLRGAVDRTGRAVVTPDRAAISALSPGIAALMTGLLENVTRYGVARAIHGTYGFDRPVAGKTGTTNDFRDAWFIGFTPEIVAGAWVGYDRPRSIGDQAAHTALPLWARAVGRMLTGYPVVPFANDAELEWVAIDPWLGCRPDSLGRGEVMPFLFGTAPTSTCGFADLASERSNGIESVDPDSNAASDSIGMSETDSLLRADTTRRPWPSPAPSPLPDTTEAPRPHP